MDRMYDIISGADDLEPLFSIKQFPVFQGSVTTPPGQDLKADLNFYISRGSGMVQLTPLLPLDVIYQSEHNPGTNGQIWLDHHKAFAEFVLQHNPTSVYEIGGSHGILSENCYAQDPGIKWTIIEPVPVPVEGLHATVVNGFFDLDTVIPQDVDMIVHSHVLEHMYNPGEFFERLSQLPIGTQMCFSVPSLYNHIEQKFTNALSFEHTYFCINEYILYWLAQSGYLVKEIQTFGDHSVFYSTMRAHAIPIPMPNRYEQNKKLFTEYIDYHKQNIDALNTRIKNAGVPVYLFGAHVFSQSLLAMGLQEEHIVAVLDNSPLKQNRRLYGTGLRVYSPKLLAEVDDAIVILQAGQYTNEIRQEIVDNINTGVTFI